MSLYPVSNYNIGTGVTTGSFDTLTVTTLQVSTIQDITGNNALTFSAGVMTAINTILGSISSINTTGSSANTNYYITFVPNSSTSTGQTVFTDSTNTLQYNPSTGTLTATTFNGGVNYINTNAMSGTTFYPIFVNTSGTVSNQIPWTKSTFSYNNSTSTLSVVNYSGTQYTIGGTNTMSASVTRTLFAGGSGITVNSGVAIGTGYTDPSIVGLSMICNAGSTDAIVIYDNAIANMLFNLNGVRITTTLPITSTGGFIGSLTGRATLISTTLQSTGTQFISFVPLSATTSAGQVVGTDGALSYNVATSTLTVTDISSSGTHYVNVLEATSGIGILNSAFLELNSSSLKRWLINCTADPTNNLQFSYYNGVFAVSYATLSVGGTFSTTNLSATGTITGNILHAVNQIQTYDIGVGLTANYTYFYRGNGATFFGSVVAGSPANQLTITTAGVQVISGTLTSPTITCAGVTTSQTNKATFQTQTYDTTTPFTDYSYIQRTSGITYLGQVTGAGGYNAITYTGTNVSVASELSVNGTIKGFTGQVWLYDVAVTGNYCYLQYYATVFYAILLYFGTPYTMYYCSNTLFVCNGTCYAPAFVVSSCKNLKENIEDLCGNYCANFIKKLKPKRYNYKKVFDKDGIETKPDIHLKTRFGLLAQDVESDLCHCENLGVYQEPKEKESAGINYIEIIAPLVKVVQDLMLQQQNLMKTITEQNERIKVLENKING